MNLFEKNVGDLDRAVRIVLGAALLGSAVFSLVEAPLSYALGLVGAILVLTGVFGRCGIYSVFGINTAKKK
jgi:hypothetical protein